MPNTIVLKPKDGISRRYEEGRVAAGQTITPGMLIALNSSGEIVVHGSAGVAALNEPVMMIAIEDGLIGRTIDTNYAAGELCRYVILLPGDEFYGILVDGENAAVQSPLTSNGDGKFQVATGTEKTLARSLEALNLVGGAAADGRLKMRVVN